MIHRDISRSVASAGPSLCQHRLLSSHHLPVPLLCHRRAPLVLTSRWEARSPRATSFLADVESTKASLLLRARDGSYCFRAIWLSYVSVRKATAVLRSADLFFPCIRQPSSSNYRPGRCKDTEGREEGTGAYGSRRLMGVYVAVTTMCRFCHRFREISRN